MHYTYAVLGAGRQGVAAAYDMARHGDAVAVLLADVDLAVAKAGAERVNRLLSSDRVRAAQVDVSNEAELIAFLADVDAALSAAPYRFNVGISRAAIASRTHLCDLGGNTDIVWQQLALDAEARAAGVSIIPDCGLQPGMGNTLAAYAMAQMSHPREVRIWVGGLPQKPSPPFDFSLTFNVEGLTNEYDGNAVVLRGGRRVELPAFTEVEMVDFPAPVGRCEAFITVGGTSTCPWTFEGVLEVYEEKTVRYPGHAAVFRAFRDLGLFDRVPVPVNGQSVVPREVYHTLLEPKITFPCNRDIVVLRVACRGRDNGREKEVVIDLMDFYDVETGFSAMERTTGWAAAIVAQMMARGETPPGAVPLEQSVPPASFMAQARQRGFVFTEQVKTIEKLLG
ncbi:MAG: saccharopine dehydrogenase NADP-binding domain-containing protein [Anaerolineae bacterium]|nr:saccharopine dehydrogenase NADP-binding domain-containing protein [Anaerolineae bacterium]